MIKEDTGILVRGTRLAEIAREARRGLPGRQCSRMHLWTQWRDAFGGHWRTLYVVSSLGQLTRKEELLHLRKCGEREFRFLVFADDLPIESIPEHLCRLQVRSGKRVHLAQVHETDAVRSFLARFVKGLCGPSADGAILDAWWDGEEFVVLAPSFERLRVPLNSLPTKLQEADGEIRAEFQIDPHGDFVHWPRLDVHMGWEQFAQAVDPTARLRAEQKSDEFNARYGRTIRSFRETSHLNQSDIEGLDERTVRRIEQGQTRVTANAIAKLAKAHGMEASEYMAALSRHL